MGLREAGMMARLFGNSQWASAKNVSHSRTSVVRQDMSPPLRLHLRDTAKVQPETQFLCKLEGALVDRRAENTQRDVQECSSQYCGPAKVDEREKCSVHAEMTRIHHELVKTWRLGRQSSTESSKKAF